MNALQPILQSCLPKCKDPAGWAPILAESLRSFTPAVVAAFLSQVAVESQELNRVAENLNYTATRLMQVWPKRFPTLVSASDCAGSPERLANRVYGGRLGNGPEASGDGYRYRGRGLLQITGRTNYKAAEAALRLPLVAHPELLEQRPVALLASINFWNREKLSVLVGTAEQFAELTRKINGGDHGQAERAEYWRRFRAALGVE